MGLKLGFHQNYYYIMDRWGMGHYPFHADTTYLDVLLACAALPGGLPVGQKNPLIIY